MSWLKPKPPPASVHERFVTAYSSQGRMYVLNYHPSSGHAWGNLNELTLKFRDDDRAKEAVANAPILNGALMFIEPVARLPTQVRRRLGWQ